MRGNDGQNRVNGQNSVGVTRPYASSSERKTVMSPFMLEEPLGEAATICRSFPYQDGFRSTPGPVAPGLEYCQLRHLSDFGVRGRALGLTEVTGALLHPLATA